MSGRLDAELIDWPVIDHGVVSPVADFKTYPIEDERPMAPARGIIMAVFMSAPFWALFGFVLYKLL